MKTIILTPQDIVDLVCADENSKYILLEEILVNKYTGDMSIEYTYDYIFQLKETDEQYIVRVNVGDLDKYEWEMNYLDECESQEVKNSIAQKGTWFNTPRFVIDKNI